MRFESSRGLGPAGSGESAEGIPGFACRHFSHWAMAQGSFETAGGEPSKILDGRRAFEETASDVDKLGGGGTWLFGNTRRRETIQCKPPRRRRRASRPRCGLSTTTWRWQRSCGGSTGYRARALARACACHSKPRSRGKLGPRTGRVCCPCIHPPPSALPAPLLSCLSQCAGALRAASDRSLSAWRPRRFQATAGRRALAGVANLLISTLAGVHQRAIYSDEHVSSE